LRAPRNAAAGSLGAEHRKAAIGVALPGHPFDAVASHSTIESCTDCARIAIEGRDRAATWAGSVAAGAAIGGRPGCRPRAAVRDVVVLGLPGLTAAADPLAEHLVAPTSLRAVHRVTLALGLDIVTNGPRRRRHCAECRAAAGARGAAP
jgi:hypothetical protein